jgi:hypothetical protein
LAHEKKGPEMLVPVERKVSQDLIQTLSYLKKNNRSGETDQLEKPMPIIELDGS